MSYNKCFFNLDIKLWQFICDEITDEGLKYLTNATIIYLYWCKK